MKPQISILMAVINIAGLVCLFWADIFLGITCLVILGVSGSILAKDNLSKVGGLIQTIGLVIIIYGYYNFPPLPADVAHILAAIVLLITLIKGCTMSAQQMNLSGGQTLVMIINAILKVGGLIFVFQTNPLFSAAGVVIILIASWTLSAPETIMFTSYYPRNYRLFELISPWKKFVMTVSELGIVAIIVYGTYNSPLLAPDTAHVVSWIGLGVYLMVLIIIGSLTIEPRYI